MLTSSNAATGPTAAELIAQRANHAEPDMGLSTWKGDAVTRSDVTVARNDLQEDEISELNRIVVMWLDFAEDQARRRKQVFLRDRETRLDDFLRFNDRDVLQDAGSVSKAEADEHARAEYDRFSARRRTFLEAGSRRTSRERCGARSGGAHASSPRSRFKEVRNAPSMSSAARSPMCFRPVLHPHPLPRNVHGEPFGPLHPPVL